MGATTIFPTFSGCRQGGIESPILFNIFLDFVLRCAEGEASQKYPNAGLKYSYRISGICSTRQQRSASKLYVWDRVLFILYADDIVHTCDNLIDLQGVITIFGHTFKRFGLTISIQKTNAMAFNTTDEIKKQ